MMEKIERLPQIETERLILRNRTEQDVADLFAYGRLAEVTLPAGFLPIETLEDERVWLTERYPKNLAEKRLPDAYGITLKGEDKVIGSIDFNHRHADDVWEIGYLLHSDYWRQGIMTEAGRAFVDYAFRELGLHKLEICCYSFNEGSQGVAKKLGFTQEARIRDRISVDGKRCDELRFGLLRSEWEGRK